jgi:hypothetical protein
MAKFGFGFQIARAVIASEAKQSIAPHEAIHRAA